MREPPKLHQNLLDYVGRYTHRVAISNNRLLSMDDGKVRFKWKDCHVRFQGSQTWNSGQALFPVASSDAGMRGGGRALSDG